MPKRDAPYDLILDSAFSKYWRITGKPPTGNDARRIKEISDSYRVYQEEAVDILLTEQKLTSASGKALKTAPSNPGIKFKKGMEAAELYVIEKRLT